MRRVSFEFTHTGDRYGWVEGENGTIHFTLFIQSGRVKDTADYKLKTALREIAFAHEGDFRLTANQNLMIANVTPADRPRIEALLRSTNSTRATTPPASSSTRCPASRCPTCGLGARRERTLPARPRGDARSRVRSGRACATTTSRCASPAARTAAAGPYLAEIGFVGKSPGKYNVYLGAAFNGSRLNILYKANVAATEIVPLLSPIIRRYATERNAGERFGDFVIRAGYVKPTYTPRISTRRWAVPSAPSLRQVPPLLAGETAPPRRHRLLLLQPQLKKRADRLPLSGPPIAFLLTPILHR